MQKNTITILFIFIFFLMIGMAIFTYLLKSDQINGLVSELSL